MDNLYRVINITPPPELDCSKCHYKYDRVACRLCRQDEQIRLAEACGSASVSKQHPNKEIYSLIRGR